MLVNGVPLGVVRFGYDEHGYQLAKSHDYHLTLSQTTVPDEKDDFSDFRKSVVELLRDVIFLVGSLECFATVSNLPVL